MTVPKVNREHLMYWLHMKHKHFANMLPATSTIVSGAWQLHSAGSDMPTLIQQARQDTVHDVVACKAACLGSLCKTGLRSMNLRDTRRNAPVP